MNDNLLTHLSPDIGNLMKLEDLDLASNKLEVFPIEIWNLVNLKKLTLHNADIDTISSGKSNVSES